MKLAIRTTFIICLLSICAQAEPRTLALYLKGTGGLNVESNLMMQFELQRLLDPAGIDVVWKDHGARKLGEDFDLVVVGSIDGSCSAGETGSIPGTPAQTMVRLADTAVSGNHILPFFKVHCDELSRMLGKEIGTAELGLALARVIGHELYHILARTADHRDTGIGKAVFSLRDLIGPQLDFDMVSLAHIRRI